MSFQVTRNIPPYIIGTIQGANNTNTIAGTGTSWISTDSQGNQTSLVFPGDILIVGGQRANPIKSVDGATAITLELPLTADIASGTVYRILRYTPSPQGVILSTLYALQAMGTDSAPLGSYTYDGGSGRLKIRANGSGGMEFATGPSGAVDGALVTGLRLDVDGSAFLPVDLTVGTGSAGFVKVNGSMSATGNAGFVGSLTVGGGANIQNGALLVTNGDVQASRNGPTGLYAFGNLANKYLFYDGANYSLVGGSLSLSAGGSFTAGGTIRATGGEVISDIDGHSSVFRFGNPTLQDKRIYFDGTNLSSNAGGFFNNNGPIVANAGEVQSISGNNTGVFRFGPSSQDKRLFFDGTNLSSNAGGFFNNNGPIVANAGEVQSISGNNTGVFRFGPGENNRYLIFDGNNLLNRAGGFFNTNPDGSYAPMYASAFSVQSDYRIKTKFLPIVGATEALASVRVYEGELTMAPGKRSQYVIAHELAENGFDFVVTGEKDATYVDYGAQAGLPAVGVERMKLQSVDYIGLVPSLIAAIQELTARVKELEAAKAA